jgi:ketosteroid isomerase-like protein
MNQSNGAPSLAEARQGLGASIARHDARTAATSYTADARLLPPLGDVVQGREDIRAFWQAGVDSGICGLDFDLLDCVELGGVAYELGRYAISAISVELDTTGHMAGPARVVERGRYIAVHQLIEGRWLRAAEMFASDNQPGGDRQ